LLQTIPHIQQRPRSGLKTRDGSEVEELHREEKSFVCEVGGGAED
jgi:hypothetical protein